MRKQGVRRLIAFCLNDSCRHQALIEVWSYPANTEIAYFRRRVVLRNAAHGATRLTCGRTGGKCRQFNIGVGTMLCRVVNRTTEGPAAPYSSVELMRKQAGPREMRSLAGTSWR